MAAVLSGFSLRQENFCGQRASNQTLGNHSELVEPPMPLCQNWPL